MFKSAHDNKYASTRPLQRQFVQPQTQEAAGLSVTPYGNQAQLRADSNGGMPPVTAFRPSQAPVLQRKCACESPTSALYGECAECKAKNQMQAKLATASTEMTASPSAFSGQEAPPVVRQVLSEAGRPLDAASLAFFEPRFGLDLGHVRLHDDAQAARSAVAVGARAFTVGGHIALTDGIDTASESGRHLLAHELTHVVQQGGGSAQGKLVVGESNDVYEQEADRVAHQVMLMPSESASNAMQNKGKGRMLPSLSAIGSVSRAVVQRDDPPDPVDPFKDPTARPNPLTGPGGPLDTNDQGFTCGFENGKFTCRLDVGKGDPLSLPPTLPSSPTTPANVKGPSGCPPGKYNKLWMSCCPNGTHASADGFNCIQDEKPKPMVLPPAPPVDIGDFPSVSPGEGMEYA